MLGRAAGARAAKQGCGLPTGRPAKLNATTRAGAAQRIGDGAIPEQVAADLGVSRSTLYRELRKHREGAVAERVGRKADQRSRPHPRRSALFVAVSAITTEPLAG